MTSSDDETEIRDEESTVLGSFSELTSQRATLVLHTRRGAQAIPLHPSQSVVIGRARSADLTVPERTLSREHVRFSMTDADVWVEDLGSTNGTRVNGKKVSRALLSPGDEVDLGPVRVSLHVIGPEEAQPRALESHDRFVGALEEEIVRARMCGRKVGLIMVRSADPENAHIGRWSASIWHHLRLYERAALYSLDQVEVLLPDTDLERTGSIAEAIAAEKVPGEPALLCGAALFPDDAASLNALIEVTRRAAQRASATRPVRVLSRAGAAKAPHAGAEPDEGAPVFHSEALRAVLESARRVAPAAIPVVIQGETGVGKEVIAQAVHQGSGRKGPLRCINCGAIPSDLIESALFGHEKGAFTGAAQRSPGVFESTDGGTLLLDEIGELPLAAQTALLRVLETRRVTRVGSNVEVPVDVRVLAATHRDLEAMCQEETFRRDLFFRLNAMVLRIPPLRERREEIAPLALHFVAQANRANGRDVEEIDAEALEMLGRYAWPGNVRELRNVIERAVVIAQESRITAEDLPDRVRAAATAPQGTVVPNRLGRAPMPEVVSGRAAPQGSVAESRTVEIGLADGLAVAARDAGQAPSELGVGGVQYAEEEAGLFRNLVRHYEAALIREVWRATGGDTAEAARRLGLPRRTLQHKIRVLGVRSDDRGPAVAELEREVRMPASPEDEPLPSRVQRYEMALISTALEEAGGRTADAADKLRVPLRTLQHKMRVYEIDKPGED